MGCSYVQKTEECITKKHCLDNIIENTAINADSLDDST
jgi:hypothetical protein